MRFVKQTASMDLEQGTRQVMDVEHALQEMDVEGSPEKFKIFCLLQTSRDEAQAKTEEEAEPHRCMHSEFIKLVCEFLSSRFI